MRVVLAGGSGFLGVRLVRALAGDGHEVVRLVRRAPTGPAEVRWDPAAGVLDPGVLDGADAVVNLAGANVGRYWTDAYRRKIRDSRVDTTTTLAHALAAVRGADGHERGGRATVLVNSSAAGFYGDTGDTPVGEGAPAGEGFLADLCRAWEAATGPAEDAGVRVVHLRTGLPLDRTGGLLQPLLIPFRLGLGARLGGGRQYWPWISLPDWVGALRFLLGRTDLAGPVNLTGPEPVTNAEFTRVLGEVLRRPAVLAVPGPVLRLVAGPFGGEALASQRVVPDALTRAGFRFQHPDVRSALRWAVEHPVDHTVDHPVG
jgi:uncharacterized protein (TIGR01777 family)